MFESTTDPTADVEDVRALTRALGRVEIGIADDATRVDLLRALEDLKCSVSGAQAALAVDFDASQRATQAAAGEPRARQGRGVAAQVGLARRESHHRGRQFLGLAKIVHDEMPHTWVAWRGGRLTEWRVTILARETACLSLEDRREVDRLLAGDADRLELLGDRELEAACKKAAYRLDAASFVERSRRAEEDRRVTIRPAPDTMVQLSALLPVAQGVAAYAALKQDADSRKAEGDARSRGQLIADALVERLTGQQSAGDVRVEVGVVMSDKVLLGLEQGDARVRGYGPIPADVAKTLVRDAGKGGLAVLRRLYAAPLSGQLVAADSKSTKFRGGLADLIRLRDEDICRNLWCDAPARPVDHAKSLAEGGETKLANGQGLCEACNIAKEALGWTARPRPGPDDHVVDTTTPTGHRYTSRAPDVRGDAFVIQLPDIVFAA
jgi:hypothetical protein